MGGRSSSHWDSFSQTLDDPTTLRIAGIALALLFGGLALRMALLFRRGAVGEIILSPGGLDRRGGSEGTAVPWDAVREVSEAIVRWCREDRLRSDPR